MKMNCTCVLLLFLLFVAYMVLMHNSFINNIFGGSDKNANCLVCTNIHFNGYLTNWTVSHFLTFMIAGYICPKRVYLIILSGILWEIWELIMEYNSKTNHQNILCKLNVVECNKKMSSHDFWKHYIGFEEQPDQSLYWCSGGLLGAILDITADILGVYSGIYIANLLK